jgi:hypothetical protein
VVLGEQCLTELSDAIVIGFMVVESLKEREVEAVLPGEGGIDWGVKLHVVPGKDYLSHGVRHQQGDDALWLQRLHVHMYMYMYSTYYYDVHVGLHVHAHNEHVPSTTYTQYTNPNLEGKTIPLPLSAFSINFCTILL